MTDQPTYPYIDGDVTVLGPEIFASLDGAVISWRGENYTRTTPDYPVTSSNNPDNPPRWQPDETLDYGHLPPPTADPAAPLRTGNSLPPADDGPTVQEAADDDRRWDAEKAGEA